MIRLLSKAVLAMLSITAVGCAYVEQRHKDVSQDPKYAVGYRPGETYRLRTDGRLVAAPSGDAPRRLELWPPDVPARNAADPDRSRLVAVVPAGSTVRVDGLEHSYTFAIPPVPGDSEILYTYGTVAGDAGRWERVRIPVDPEAGWSFVPGTSVLAYPPDRRFLELVTSATRPAAE